MLGQRHARLAGRRPISEIAMDAFFCYYSGRCIVALLHLQGKTGIEFVPTVQSVRGRLSIDGSEFDLRKGKSSDGEGGRGG